MGTNFRIKGTLVILLVAFMTIAPLLTVSSTPVAADDDDNERYSVDIFVLDNFKRDDFDSINDDEGNCALDIQSQGYAVRGAGYALRGAGYALRGAGYALRGAGYATRGAGYATRGAGYATRGAGYATRGAGYATRGAGYATRGADGEMEIRYAHGKIVMWQLEELDFWYGDNVDVNLVKVRVNDYRTDRIADALAKKIRRSDADFIVVNMSFAIVPCGLVSTLAEYEAELQDSDDYGELVELQARFQELIDTVWMPSFEMAGDDEISDVMHENVNRVIPVASSGNFGLNFPLYPAGWDGVVSVSASEDFFDFNATDSFNPDTYFPLLGSTAIANGDRDMPVSNFGNVMMPGQYEDLVGASYAAPRLSYAIAYYLSMVGPDYCHNADGSFALSYGSYDNLTYQEAMNTYCPSMVENAPEELPFDIDGDGYVPWTAFVDAEDADVVLRQGTWHETGNIYASGEYYMLGYEDDGVDRLELDFIGPYIEIWYVDGLHEGRFSVEIDGDRRRTRRTNETGELSFEMTRVRNLDEEAPHTAEVYGRRGYMAIDGFFTTMLIEDPFAD